jgi:hypothetical protein
VARWRRAQPGEIDSFAADGYVAVRGAVPADVLRLCQDEIWSALGVALHDAFPLVPPLSPVELAMWPERAA